MLPIASFVSHFCREVRQTFAYLLSFTESLYISISLAQPWSLPLLHPFLYLFSNKKPKTESIVNFTLIYPVAIDYRCQALRGQRPTCFLTKPDYT